MTKDEYIKELIAQRFQLTEENNGLNRTVQNQRDMISTLQSRLDEYDQEDQELETSDTIKDLHDLRKHISGMEYIQAEMQSELRDLKLRFNALFKVPE